MKKIFRTLGLELYEKYHTKIASCYQSEIFLTTQNISMEECLSSDQSVSLYLKSDITLPNKIVIKGNQIIKYIQLKKPDSKEFKYEIHYIDSNAKKQVYMGKVTAKLNSFDIWTSTNFIRLFIALK